MEIRKQHLFITDYLLRGEGKLKNQISERTETRLVGIKRSFRI